MRGEHRLAVLLLVLRDHGENEPVTREFGIETPLVQGIPAGGTDLVDVTTRLVRAEQRQLGPCRAGMQERVVQVVDAAS